MKCKKFELKNDIEKDSEICDFLLYAVYSTVVLNLKPWFRGTELIPQLPFYLEFSSFTVTYEILFQFCVLRKVFHEPKKRLRSTDNN